MKRYIDKILILFFSLVFYCTGYGNIVKDGITYEFISEADRTLMLASIDRDTRNKITTLNIPEWILAIPSPYKVVAIKDGALSNCPLLEYVKIPRSIEKIGDNLSEGTPLLKAYYVDDENPVFKSIDGVIYDKDVKSLLIWPTDKQDIVIPETVNEIGNYAFANCSFLTKMIIPESIVKINKGIFYGCVNLREVVLPEHIDEIPESAFQNCSSLTDLSFSENVKSTGNLSFLGCGKICKFELPANLSSIGEAAFANCVSLIELKIPDTVLNIGSFVFRGCTSLINVTLPESLKFIPDHSFEFCSSLRELVIPPSVTYIGNYAFQGCKTLSYINLPENVLSLGERTFANCINLKSISFSSAFNKIDAYCFYNCESLENFIVDENNKIFASCGPMLVSKDKSTLFAYPSAKQEVEVPENIIVISSYALAGCNGLNVITLPRYLEKIQNRAFYDCYNLHRLNFLSLVPPVFGDWVFGTDTLEIVNHEFYVPEESLQLYRETFPNTYVLPLKETGVHTVHGYSLPSPYNVFTIDGRWIMKTDNPEKLQTLSPGLYIVNGKKIIF